MPITELADGGDFIQAFIDAGIVPENCIKLIIEAGARDLLKLHYTVIPSVDIMKVVQDAAPKLEVIND
jgi:hypothetical protein